MAQVFHHGCVKQLKSVPGFKVLLTISFEARWCRVKGLDFSDFGKRTGSRPAVSSQNFWINIPTSHPSKQCWGLMDRPETDETYETFGPCDVSGALHWHQRLWQHCTATWFWWRWGRWCHHQIAEVFPLVTRKDCVKLPDVWIFTRYHPKRGSCPTGNPYLRKNLISTFSNPTSTLLNFDFLEWNQGNLAARLQWYFFPHFCPTSFGDLWDVRCWVGVTPGAT